ncbi:MAG: hypothetical protein ABI441_10490 [Flavobacterium sp.]
MEHKKYPTIMRVFSSLLLVFSFQISFACGWSVSPETSRLSLFKPQREGFFKLTPFYYSADAYYSTNTISSKDQELNCLEWKKKLGSQINSDDVNFILYQTDAEQFQTAYETKSLKKVFEKNTFIEALLQSKNKAFLDYILFAKKLEYNSNTDVKWESWDKIGYGNQDHKLADLDNFDKKITKTKDAFLKQRYAFLCLRYSFYSQDSKEVIRLYDTYFTDNKNTILEPWALYYKALCIDNKALQNYLLSKVFATCEEKSFAVLQHYNWKITVETLALAQNDEERSVILAIESLRNPAPDLKTIKEVFKLSPNSLYLSFLIGREVNKLEDWIFTPQYTSSSPSVVFSNEEDWYQDYAKAKAENFSKDILYLREVKDFLIDIREQTSGEQKEYVTTAIAQLCFIDDEIDLGKKYTTMISGKANASIQMQKNIQLALVTLKQDDLKNEKAQNQLFNYFNSVENLVETDYGLFKNLYSLYRIASDEFYKKGDRVTAGLLFMKSEIKNEGEYAAYNTPYFYTYIGYFDRHEATTDDADRLIALQQKQNKTPFEKYICSGTIAPNADYYRDLKGTIAFRNNNLELAYATFLSMPKDFWEKNYEYKSYLNENPFMPKILQTNEERKFDYHFNKTEFIAKLIQLKKQNTAESNLQLAHAYFNVSYLGNSWMMTAYDWTSGESYIDYVYGDNTDVEKKYQNGNYYKLAMAKMYYEKAFKMSKNKDQKALASLMIFECNYYSFYADYVNVDDKKSPFKAGQELLNFYSVYKTTPTFKRYNCPMLKSFIN